MIILRSKMIPNHPLDWMIKIIISLIRFFCVKLIIKNESYFRLFLNIYLLFIIFYLFIQIHIFIKNYLIFILY